MFALLFENEGDRTTFSMYYTPNVQTKDFNLLYDEKNFFDTLIENKEETFEKIIDMRRNNGYTTGNLLDC